MITVSIKQLMSAIEEADIYEQPDMNEGTGYLYSNLYRRLSSGFDVKLSDLDFEAFEPEDIETLNGLHRNIFERDKYMTKGIVSTLRNASPAHKAVAYV